MSRPLYTLSIRPVLEYGSYFWSQNFELHILRFALCGLGCSEPFNLPAYEDSCKLLNLQTLANRRYIFGLMFNLWFHSHKLINSSFLCSVLAINSPVYALRHFEFRRPRFHGMTYGQIWANHVCHITIQCNQRHLLTWFDKDGNLPQTQRIRT
jgi:hypothetical protein